jgi:hypothetical protein
VFAALALVTALACSNDDTTAPGDTTPPARVTDLAILSAGDSTLTLQWTAPGDDGHTGKAKSYQIRWSHALINGSNFSTATAVANPPAPLTASTVQQFTVTGLDTTLVTHIALRARDEAGNYSQVSNDAIWPPDGLLHLVKDIPAFKDNSMYEEDGNLSNGKIEYLFTGRTQGLAGSPFNRRALLAFAISDSIPAGAVIDSVQLFMHVSKERNNTARATSLHRLDADWGEGNSDSNDQGGAGAAAATDDATWVYRFWNTDTWATPGGDFAAGASATTSIGALGFYNWKSAQMKTDVQGWLDTPASNFGWIVLGNESLTGSAKRLDSRENPTPANRPALKVFYTVP